MDTQSPVSSPQSTVPTRPGQFGIAFSQQDGEKKEEGGADGAGAGAGAGQNTSGGAFSIEKRE